MREKEKSEEDLLKAFVERSKKSQEERDKRRMEEQEEAIGAMQEQQKRLEQEYWLVREQLERENKDLRISCIKLASENKALKAKT